ncbi:MAG: ribulose-phosphate 3-epimerase [Clostridia bacterium]|nr:ribulose-phosphate 3-epimerase [Clostridia bacterium]
MKNQIAPSMMCTDILKLKETIEVFEKNDIDYLHIDVMDGKFVPNYCLGTDYCKRLKKASKIPLDIHLMISEPENKIHYFEFSQGDYVSVHSESTNHLQRTLNFIKAKGAKAMVAFNPATDIACLKYVGDIIDGVLIMTVNPGYAGQPLVESCIKKITEVREFLDKNGFKHVEIEVDGNVSFENAKRMKQAGANIFVAGNSSIFRSDLTIEEGIHKLREAIQ